jgi:hypothetical protein
MIPETHVSSEPEDLPVGDRRFSDLPLEDRWRLVKEAIRDIAALIDYRRTQKPVRIILGVSLGVGILILTAEPARVTFMLWFAFQFLLIVVLLLFERNVDHQRVLLSAQIAKVLENIEVHTLKSGGHGGAT